MQGESLGTGLRSVCDSPCEKIAHDLHVNSLERFLTALIN